MRILKRLVVATAVVLAGAASSASAKTIDLTTAGSSDYFTLGTDLFLQVDDQSTGTGVIDPFVRYIENTDIVQGYNTDARPTQFDENSSATFTHSLLLSTVPTVTVNGVVYRSFLLDIDQEGADPLLSLNELQLFLGNAGNLSGASVGAGGLLSFGTDAYLIYDMDSTGENTVELDYSLNGGQGAGDMYFYVANSLFTGPNTFVYLYSKFGVPNNDNNGPDEWAIVCPRGAVCGGGSDDVNPVPEPGSLMLLGSGLVFAANRFRQRKKN